MFFYQSYRFTSAHYSMVTERNSQWTVKPPHIFEALKEIQSS